MKNHQLIEKIPNYSKVILILGAFIILISCNNNSINPLPGKSCEDNDSVGVWKFLGLAEETITAIAVNPEKQNIIYAGTSKDFSAGIPGRLYRSTDCGKTWVMIMERNDYSFTQVLYDPNNSNIIYAVPYILIKSINGGIT